MNAENGAKKVKAESRQSAIHFAWMHGVDRLVAMVSSVVLFRVALKGIPESQLSWGRPSRQPQLARECQVH